MTKNKPADNQICRLIFLTNLFSITKKKNSIEKNNKITPCLFQISKKIEN